MHMFHVNYLVVLVGAAIQWVLGALWYGVVFKKSWKSLVGGGGETGGGRAAFAMVSSFIASVILCYVLVNVIMWAGAPTFVAGASLAIVCWLGFMAPPLFAQHIYEHRPVNLFAINAGYWVVAMAVSGGVLAVWR